MIELLFSLVLIIISFLIYRRNLFKKIIIAFKKNKLEKYFYLKELKGEIEEFHKKKTVLYFCCEKIISKYYSRLIIFGEEYQLKENDIIKIDVNKLELMFYRKYNS